MPAIISIHGYVPTQTIVGMDRLSSNELCTQAIVGSDRQRTDKMKITRFRTVRSRRLKVAKA